MYCLSLLSGTTTGQFGRFHCRGLRLSDVKSAAHVIIKVRLAGLQPIYYVNTNGYISCLIFTFRAGRTVWKSHFRKVYCTMARGVARGPGSVSCLHSYTSWQNTMIINYTLSRLRTGLYFAGLLKVVWDFLLRYDASSVGNGPRRFDGIYCRHLLGGMGPKRSVIRLPFDAATYPRRTESSAAPLRAPLKVTQINWCKNNILAEWGSHLFSYCSVVFLSLPANEFVIHVLFEDSVTTWKVLCIVCVWKWWMESESVLCLLRRNTSWMQPMFSSHVNTRQVVEWIADSNVSKKHIVTGCKI
jgi:hypothetical protein